MAYINSWQSYYYFLYCRCSFACLDISIFHVLLYLVTLVCSEVIRSVFGLFVSVLDVSIFIFLSGHRVCDCKCVDLLCLLQTDYLPVSLFQTDFFKTYFLVSNWLLTLSSFQIDCLPILSFQIDYLPISFYQTDCLPILLFLTDFLHISLFQTDCLPIPLFPYSMY